MVNAFDDLPVNAFDDITPPDSGPRAAPQSRSESAWERIKRGGWLGARYLLETPALAAAGLADLGSAGVNAVTGGQIPTNRAEWIEGRFTEMGFPEPQGDMEKVGQRIGRGVVGAMAGPAVGARMAASQLPVRAGVGRVLAESPGLQGVGATTASAAGAAAERAGAGPGGQMAAELAGGVIGPAGAVGAMRTAGSAVGVAGGVRDALTREGNRRIARDVLDRSAINPQTVRQRLDDYAAFGGGVSDRTTGQVTRDPGILTLERASRAIDAEGRFAQRMSQQNQQRQRILDVLGGEDVEVAKAARDATTGAQREAALSSAGRVNPEPIFGRIDAMLRSPEGTRRVVKRALNSYRRDIEDIIEDGGLDARRLYEIRKDINDAMQGRFSGARSDYGMAKSQLKQLKNVIDEQIERVAPGFREYLSDYARLSRDIDQRGIIQDIQNRATLAASDPTTGREILSQARFKRLVNNSKSDLTDEQYTVMSAIADDLDAGQATNAATVRPPGSDTAKNLTVAHILGRATGGAVDGPLIRTLARPLQWLTNIAEDRVQEIVVEAMLDPQAARILLQRPTQGNTRRFAAWVRSNFPDLRDRSLPEVAATMGAGAVTGGAAQTREQPQ